LRRVEYEGELEVHPKKGKKGKKKIGNGEKQGEQAPVESFGIVVSGRTSLG